MRASGASAASRVRLGVAAFFTVFSASAAAPAITQPTPGTLVIPVLKAGVIDCSDGSAENCLDQSEGDSSLIDSQKDALIAPEVFQPLCSLTFKPIVKGGGDHVAFGWYNVKPDPANPGQFLKPTQEELFGMFRYAVGFRTAADLAGEMATLDLAKEAAAGRYKGGQIGFFLAGADPNAQSTPGGFGPLKLDPVTHALTGMVLTRVFYTQHALNPGSSGQSTYYQVLTWQSVKFKNSFYFGWEDRQASASADNDFDDLMFRVEGIQCTGGGEPCDTGKMGVCAEGTKQCEKGDLTCVQNIQPSDEKCNALDDDCNGMVDDGDLCDAGKVCDRGRCVPKCNTGEFKCPTDLVCNARHVCVEPACAKLDCPAGQVCHDGNCIDSCKGVVCPYGEVCRNGSCVDPCSSIQCDSGYTCVLGVCRSCACTSCDGGQVCHENVCVDSGCENQSCMAGSHCAMGQCVDDCANTKCPQGEICAAGACVPDPNASVGGSGDMGGMDGTGGNIVITIGGTDSNAAGGTTGTVTDAGTTSGGSKADTGGTNADDLPTPTGNGSGQGAGCGCQVPGGRAPASSPALLLIGALLLRRKRQ